MDAKTAHCLAGGVGGTCGAVLTMPLEVVKVRLQSSQNSYFTKPVSVPHPHDPNLLEFRTRQLRKSKGISTCLKQVIQQEGLGALWKGLGPTLVGVLPSRGIYFYTYNGSQSYLSPIFGNHPNILTLSSATIGGLTSSTISNPIWFVKTRLQLDNTHNAISKTTWWNICRITWKQDGLRGFYRGVQASYVGVVETAVNFLVYENIKRNLLNWAHTDSTQNYDTVHPTSFSQLHRWSDMLFCMAASGCSKTFATTLMYPHEVARTRLREGNPRYRRFFATLMAVVQEEGFRGLYRGLTIHYARQVPNNCIMIGVYEGIVYLFDDYGFIKVPP